jgi:hypothetical protein
MIEMAQKSHSLVTRALSKTVKDSQRLSETPPQSCQMPRQDSNSHVVFVTSLLPFRVCDPVGRTRPMPTYWRSSRAKDIAIACPGTLPPLKRGFGADRDHGQNREVELPI